MNEKQYSLVAFRPESIEKPSEGRSSGKLLRAIEQNYCVVSVVDDLAAAAVADWKGR
jgi:hypothetical protein